MMPSKLILTIACIAASAMGFNYRTGSVCDFSGVDLDSLISRILRQLPDYEPIHSTVFDNEFAGIELLGLQIRGLNELRQYGAVIPFCKNGTRMIQADFTHDGGVSLIVPWRTCFGNEGYLILQASVSRFTTLFRIEQPSSGQEARLVFDGPTITVTTEGLTMAIIGGGFYIDILARYISLTFPAMLRVVWNQYFFHIFNQFVIEALA